jgi:2-polyprenyl-6-hydroxyphenyl methylase/3-demethylubiquinone-9 3-methyltransferase
MPTITPCLWFDGKAEEAAAFYTSLLPDSRIDKVHRAPSNCPSGRAGDVLTVEFTLMGPPFVGLNGGPHFKFNEAVSFQIPVKTQREEQSSLESKAYNYGSGGMIRNNNYLTYHEIFFDRESLKQPRKVACHHRIRLRQGK